MNHYSQTQQRSDFEEVQKTKPGFITKFQPKLTKIQKAYQHAKLVKNLKVYLDAKAAMVNA